MYDIFTAHVKDTTAFQARNCHKKHMFRMNKVCSNAFYETKNISYVYQ